MQLASHRSRESRARNARIAAVAALLTLAACAQPRLPNIVLITLDTTRADHLRVYGYARARMPNLDRFARQAVVYETAYSTSSWTLPSHASLFTGLLPMQHGAQTTPEGSSNTLGYTVRPLAERFDTLAEILSAAGYRTGAVIAGPALRRELGVAQGFQFFDDDFAGREVIYNGRRAEVVAQRAIAIARRLGEGPFFLFVNFFDPHAPYQPPPPYDAGLTEYDEGPFILNQVDRLRALLAGREPSRPETWERGIRDAMIAGYDAELAYLDIHLGRLLDELRSREPLLIAITSDHGESFGEHHYTSHGAHLYEDNVRVPMIVRYADGRGAGTRVARPLQNHRLFATILEAARLSPPPGVAIRGLAADGGIVVTEVRRSDNNVKMFGEIFDRDLRAIYLPPLKLIESSTGRAELFDLAADPDETQDLATAQPESLERLSGTLAEVSTSHPELFEPTARADLGPETAEALRALGYLD